MTDGTAIRRCRKHSGLQIAELTDKVGISRQYLANIERGTRQGSPKVILKIAQALGVPVQDITVG